VLTHRLHSALAPACHLRYKLQMRIMLLVALALFGCKRDSEPTVRSTVAVDSLWNLAPEGARGGIVVAPSAVEMVERGSIPIRSLISQAPEFGELKTTMDAALAQLGGPNVKLADLGMNHDKGAALFFVKDGMVAILPVDNRDVFLAKVKGTKGATIDKIDTASCKQVGDAYACATSEALLATVGKGQLKSKLDRVNARGDVEIVGVELPLGGPAPGTVAAVAQLERGAATLRGVVINAPHELLDRLGPPTHPRVPSGTTSGFGVIDLRPMLKTLPPTALMEGLTVADLVKTFSAPLTISVPAGELTIEMQLPLSDPAPMKRLVEHCTDLPALTGAATIVDGACHISVPEASLELDAWVDGNLLRVGRKSKPLTGKAIAMSQIGNEIANGEWAIAFWGRGSMFAPSMQKARETEGINPVMAMPIRVLSTINEAGLAVKTDGDALRFVATVRTSFSNPDDVVAKLTAITAMDLLSNKATDKAKPIAEAHSGTPFADDFAAGQGGLLVPTTQIGMGASIVIPALIAYTRGHDPKPDAPIDDTQAVAPPKGELTKLIVQKIATEAYAQWIAKNPGKPCPTLIDLGKVIGGAIPDDEWGHPYVVKCGKDLPAAAKGFAIVSSGADGKPGTADDITSY